MSFRGPAMLICAMPYRHGVDTGTVSFLSLITVLPNTSSHHPLTDFVCLIARDFDGKKEEEKRNLLLLEKPVLKAVGRPIDRSSSP